MCNKKLLHNHLLCKKKSAINRNLQFVDGYIAFYFWITSNIITLDQLKDLLGSIYRLETNLSGF